MDHPGYRHYEVTIEELPDGCLFMTVGGGTREEDLETFFDGLDPLLAERAPARILVDASRLGETERRVQWLLVRRMRANRRWIERTAIFGLPPRMETALWIWFTLSGRSNIRTFLWRHEAHLWLAGEELPSALA